MPDISIDIELYCNTCGSGICGNGMATYTRRQPCFRIDACEKCTENARDDGYEKGYEAARKEFCRDAEEDGR